MLQSKLRPMTQQEMQFLRSFPARTCPRGTCLVHSGDTLRHVYFLESGVCARKAVTESGEEITYDVREADGTAAALVGALQLYYFSHVSGFDICAVRTSFFRLIPEADFYPFVRAHPLLMEDLLHIAAEGYAYLNCNLLARKSMRVGNLICLYLQQHTHVDDRGRLVIDARLSNSEIGRQLAINRVTVVRVMQALASAGVVETRDNVRQVTDPERLSRFASNEETLRYASGR